MRHLSTLVAALGCAALSMGYAITGVTTGIGSDGSRPSRQDIRNFASSGAAWDLYIQALQQFQATGQDQMLSYFQVSSIHGLPNSWDNSPGYYDSGYCTHSSVIFPPWHRPYLALYEQIISNNAMNIANSYPTSSRARYQAAAQTLRIPYWDWASDSSMPAACTSSSITINTPSGSRTISNPLYSYAFHPHPSQFPSSDGEVAQCSRTVRNPDANCNSNNAGSNSQLRANQGYFRDATYSLLTRVTSYGPFSNTGYTGRDAVYDSLEAIHNSIHGLVGQDNGHMSYVTYSSYDPIFWLHHANVDRIFAMWQVLNPNSWVSPQQNQFGTYTFPPGWTENANTALTPFRRNTQGTYYSSNSARLTRYFGYTYPECNDWSGTTADQQARVRTAVRQLYGPSSSGTSRRSLQKRSGDSFSVPSTLKDADGVYNNWYINYQLDKHEMQKPVYMFFFLGNCSTTDAKSYASDPTHVATYATFTHHDTSGAAPNNVVGSIPLTRALVKAHGAGLLKSLQSSDVKPYLTKNLAYKVTYLDYTPVPSSLLTTLKVFPVEQATVPAVSTSSFPKYLNLIPHTDIPIKLGNLNININLGGDPSSK